MSEHRGSKVSLPGLDLKKLGAIEHPCHKPVARAVEHDGNAGKQPDDGHHPEIVFLGHLSHPEEPADIMRESPWPW